jgi:hypothetical protein
MFKKRNYRVGRFAEKTVIASGFAVAFFIGLYLLLVIAMLMSGDRTTTLSLQLIGFFLGGTLLVAIGYAVLAIFDLTEHVCESDVEPTAKETTTPSDEQATIDNEQMPMSDEQAERERSAEVERRIADYEARKNKGIAP